MPHGHHHRQGGGIRRVLIAVPPPNTIFVLKFFGQDADCGCPCGGFPTIQCDPNAWALMDSNLKTILSDRGFNFDNLAAELNTLLSKTWIPMLPCLFAHFIIPFSPICAMKYYEIKRRSGTERIAADYTKFIVHHGLAWFVLNHLANYSYCIDIYFPYRMDIRF